MSARERWVITANWSGYYNLPHKVCHRQVVGPKQAAAVKKVSGVGFTDGTHMYIEVRRAFPREKVVEIHGYDDVIRDIWLRKLEGFQTIADVHPLEVKKT